MSRISKAIVHIDGDAFFASCEQVKNKKLCGKPVVTGKERGIAASMSYEAKRQGVKRGMPIREIKRVCPECIIVPSDYETYSLFSLRMFEIVRRYTPEVEEYSIDECFADITGLRRPLKMSYTKIARNIKEDLDRELGFTFSLGLAPTKVLAKIGSSWNKPDGFTVISKTDIDEFLTQIEPQGVWGVGPNTASYMKKLGIQTARDFANKDIRWVARNFSKPYQEIWHELRGEMLHEVNTKGKREYKSISKSKTFTKNGEERDFIFSQLSKNVENACAKARRYNLASDTIIVILKTVEFKTEAFEVTLDAPVNTPEPIISAVDAVFDNVWSAKKKYRKTGVVLSKLQTAGIQDDLFGYTAHLKRYSRIHEKMDDIRRRFGKYAVFLGSSFRAVREDDHAGARGENATRKRDLLPGETPRKRLSIPYVGEVS